MAEALLDSFLTCSICLESFSEPVTLGCNHSFCSSCLHQHWSHQAKTCPVCRRRYSKYPAVNFALKELSEQFRRSLQLSACRGADTEEEEGTSWSVCSSHPQEPLIFCLEDERPLCSICELCLHPQHTLLTGEEAEEKLKELMSSQLQALQEEKLHCTWLQHKNEKIQRHTEEQARQCERHIRAEFSGLHRFLQEEEHRALSALKEEMRRHHQNMGPELQRVKNTLSAVEKSIKELEKHLQAHTYTQQQSIPPRLMPKAGLLLDQAKVLGNLGFRVWKNMRRKVQYFPVLLDPNTAHRQLYLSEDLTSVRREDSVDEDVPLNPERFTFYSSVLGSEGFSSGLHQWDVEVGDHPWWAIGVVKESVEREEKYEHLPDSGHWCLRCYKGKYYDVLYNPLILQRRPQKVRVRLDYDEGQLTFSDADHMTPICSYTESFTERLFPCFPVGAADGAETTEIRICEDLSATV